jgi:hypothetical protein
MKDSQIFVRRTAKTQTGLFASVILSAAVVLVLDVVSSILHFEDSFSAWIVAAVMFFAVALFVAGYYGGASPLNIGGHWGRHRDWDFC